MNREIKFRGKSKESNSWVYGYYFKTTEESLIMEEKSGLLKYYKIFPETAGQFTELYDKNGKEIYEGDILKGGIYLSYEVEWDYEDNGWNVKNEYTIREHYEIIGNIYENPKFYNNEKSKYTPI